MLPEHLSQEVSYPGASFLDAENGFIVWTQNQHWDQTTDASQFTLVSAETKDGAKSWQVHRQSVSGPFPYGGVHEMQFENSRVGHLILGVGAGAGQTFKGLFVTHNGGQSWDRDTSSDSIVGNENAPVHMLFLSKTDGWILRGLSHGQPPPNILLFHTTSDGNEWHRLDKFVPPSACHPDCWLFDVSTLFVNSTYPRRSILLGSL